MAENTHKTPQQISEEFRLTATEKAQLEIAQKKALVKESVDLRLQTLKANLDDALETKIGLENLRALVEEDQSMLDSAVDGVEDAYHWVAGVVEDVADTAEGSVKSIPGVGSTLRVGEDVSEAASKAMSPWDALKKIWTKVEEFFKTWDFSVFDGLWGDITGDLSDVRKGMKVMDEVFDLWPGNEEKLNELLIDCKPFRKITIAQLKAAKDNSDIAGTLGIDADYENTLESFVEFFFEEESHKKLLEVAKKKGIDINKLDDMTIFAFTKALGK